MKKLGGRYIVIMIAITLIFMPYIIGKPVTQPHIGFHSHIEIHLDEDILAQPIPIDQDVAVECKIRYYTDVPEDFLWFLPGIIRNLILYWSITPIQNIHLEVEESIDWLEINFTRSDIVVEIPMGGEVVEEETSLIIHLSETALAVPVEFKVTASCSRKGLIQGVEATTVETLTPEWIPCLRVDIDQPTIHMDPGSMVLLSINVSNESNGDTEVKTEIKEYDYQDYVFTSIEPETLQLDIDEVGVFQLMIKASSSISHIVTTIPIEFTPCHPSTMEEGEPIVVYVEVMIP